MAIGIGATTFGTTSAAGAATLTFAHTVAAGSDRCLIVRINQRQTAVLTATYGGAAMVEVASFSDSGSNHVVRIFSMLAPPVGTANVELTMATANDMMGVATNLTGVAQSDTFGTAVGDGINSTGSTTRSVNVTSAADELVVDVIGVLGSASNPVAGAGQTSQGEARTGTTTSDRLLAVSTKPGEATTTMSWTWTTKVSNALIAVPVRPAVAPAAVPRFQAFIA